MGQRRAKINRITGHRGSDVLHAVVVAFGGATEAGEVDFPGVVVLMLSGTQRQVYVPRTTGVAGVAKQAIRFHVGRAAGVVTVVVHRSIGVAEYAARAPTVVHYAIGTE
ncbi:hypothetical protein D3C81_1937560 [compost metagenome]